MDGSGQVQASGVLRLPGVAVAPENRVAQTAGAKPRQPSSVVRVTDAAQSSDPDVLYDDRVRVARLPGTRSETAPQMLQRMGGQYWDDVRPTMNRWFDHVPPADREKLRGKLTGKDSRQFRSAFWELYLHETFFCAGFTVVVEGKVPGSERRPDFRITKGDESWYVEARLADKAPDPGALQRVNRALDLIDAVKGGGWAIRINVERIGPSDLRKAALEAPIPSWIDTLDAGAGTEGLLIEEQGWKIDLLPMLKSHDPAWIDKRLIGTLSTSLDHWPGTAEDIKKALRDKTHAYGRLDAPLIIALVAGGNPNELDVTDALYGDLQLSVTWTDPGTETTFSRKTNGQWYRGTEWANPHVAGVLIGRQVDPTTIATIVPTMWRHPAEETEVPQTRAWRYAEPLNGEVVFREPVIHSRGLFGLPDEWCTTPLYDYDAPI